MIDNAIIHVGNDPPVPDDTYVWVDLGGGESYAGRADDCNWGPADPGPGGMGRILRYVVIPTPVWT